jgi:hypothetical protein
MLVDSQHYLIGIGGLLTVNSTKENKRVHSVMIQEEKIKKIAIEMALYPNVVVCPSGCPQKLLHFHQNCTEIIGIVGIL